MTVASNEKTVNVLIVEDDVAVAAALGEALQHHGFSTRHALTAADAFDECEAADLILLDLGLPDLDGVVLCQRVRERTAAPIIIITARADEVDVVLGLQAGADDYLVKPYGQRELLARISAVRRRVGAGATARVALDGAKVCSGGVEIDTRARRVSAGDVEISLTRKEYAVLAMLAEDPGRVVGREDLIATVWGDQWDGASRTLDVHVSTIRHKLGDPGLIENVRGVGYRLREA